jgi:RHS repeat-associated protein
MNPAVTHLNPVMGVDVHIIQPPGPVPPVPIPHPYIGIVFDPADYVPIIGATVKIAGLPRSQAGTAGKPIPSHIPIGGTFIKPPGNEDENFMGSSTVEMDGDAATYMGLPALSCSDVGSIAPPRVNPKKKTKMKSLVLPTCVAMAIPAGVLVGGPPTISLMALGMKAGMAAIGKLGKGLRRLQRGGGKFGRAMRKVSKKLHGSANKVMDKLGLPPSVRNRVHRGICSVTGHPVDIATGKVFTDFVDFFIPGPIPISFERVWYSTSTYFGPLGHGWHHNFDMTVIVDIEEGIVVICLGDGRYVEFEVPDREGCSWNNDERLELSQTGGWYFLRNRDQCRVYVFELDEIRSNGLQIFFLIEIRDFSGNRIRLIRKKSRLVTIEDSGGRILSITNDDVGRIKEIFAPHPDGKGTVRLVSYKYSDEGDLVESTDALDQKTQFKYMNHLLIQEIDRNMLSFYFMYDGENETARCIRTWGDSNLFARTIKYDLDAKTTTVINSLGSERNYHWNDQGLVELETDAEGNSWKTLYDGNRLTASIDPLGNKSTYEFDDRGNETGIIFPDGSQYKFQYNAEDQIVGIIDRRGGLWTFTYDGVGRLISRSDPESNITKYIYSERELVTIVEYDGRRIDIGYDSAGNVGRVNFPDGSQSIWRYDTLGRPIFIKDANGRIEKRQYDLLGRLVRVEDSTGMIREYSHDGESNLVTAHDNYSYVQMSYTGMGQIKSQNQSNMQSTFKYDTEAQLVCLENPLGNIYQFQFSRNGLPEKEIGFDGQELEFYYDSANRVSEIKYIDGVSSKWEYDPMGRITKTDWSDETSESFIYDPAGAVIQAKNNNLVVSFERDVIGRVVKEWQGDHWVATSFDKSGLIVRLETSFGLVQTIERDEEGRVEYISVTFSGEKRWETECQYSPDNQINAILPGELNCNWKYDNHNRPLRQEIVHASTTLRAREYLWGAHLRIKELRDSIFGTRVFVYDQFDRLSGFESHDGSFYHHRSDVAGNLLQSGQGRENRSYGSAGELLTLGQYRYKYDKQGRLIRKENDSGEIWRYEWLDSGFLNRVFRPDNKVVDFEYDALGRRIAKRFDGKVTRWLWDDNVPVHEWVELELGVNNGQSTQILSNNLVSWVFGPDQRELVAKLEGQQAYSIVCDHLETPLSMWDDKGNQIWYSELGLRGEWLDGSQDRSRCPFRFAGQYEDNETGYYYNRFRYYDPHGGCYISQDPLRLEGGGKLYGYVFNSMVASDPLGLHVVTAVFKEEGSTEFEDVTGPKGGKKFKSDAKAKSIPGRTGDSEQKVLRRLEETKTPDQLKGSTIKMTSEGDFIRLPDGRVVKAQPLKPCPDCQKALKQFTIDHPGSTIEYKAGDKKWKFKNGKMTPCK